MSEPDRFDTAAQRSKVLASWTAAPARFREDANAEEALAGAAPAHCHLPLAAPLLGVTSSSSSAAATYVAKISMDPRDNEDREIYFRDVEMQTLARYYAQLFNEYQPPKLVDFVKSATPRSAAASQRCSSGTG